MMDELIKYLEGLLEVKVSDLASTDEERYKLIGKLDLLYVIKQIDEKGYPDVT